MLYGPEPKDPVTFVLATATLIGVGALSGLVLAAGRPGLTRPGFYGMAIGDGTLARAWDVRALHYRTVLLFAESKTPLPQLSAATCPSEGNGESTFSYPTSRRRPTPCLGSTKASPVIDSDICQ